MFVWHAVFEQQEHQTTSSRKKETNLYRFAAVGLEMGISVIIGILGGLYLDRKFDTAPIFFWLGFSFGVGAALKTIVSIANFLKEETKEDDTRNIKKS